MARYFLIGLAVWWALIAAKAIARVGDGKPYVLTWWDAMNRGEHGRILWRSMVNLRIVLGLAMGPVIYAYFHGAFSGGTAPYANAGVMIGMSLTGMAADRPT